MNEPEIQQPSAQDIWKQQLNKRLETIAWGLFLISFGLVALLPDALFPDGLGLIGVGLIMIGLNVARYFYQIKVSGFTLVLGSIAILIGLSNLLGVDLPVFAILLILIGVYLIIRPIFERGQRSTDRQTIHQ